MENWAHGSLLGSGRLEKREWRMKPVIQVMQVGRVGGPWDNLAKCELGAQHFIERVF